MVAGLRCRKNKTVFLLGTLLGKRWAPEELFTSEAGARPEANTILSGMTTFLQRSSSVANKCVRHIAIPSLACFAMCHDLRPHSHCPKKAISCTFQTSCSMHKLIFLCLRY